MGPETFRPLLLLVLFLGALACQDGAPQPLPLKVDDAAMAGAIADRVDELPADPALGLAACRMLLSEGKAPEALDLSLRLVKAQPENCQAWRLRAQAFMALEDERGAFDALRSCLRARPDDAETLFSLGGMLAARHGDEPASLRESEELWTRLLERHPEHPQVGMVKRALSKIRSKLQSFETKTDGRVKSP